ncbi:MAG: hypothetical protein ACFBRM_00465 [Pikeienuella sp.]
MTSPMLAASLLAFTVAGPLGLGGAHLAPAPDPQRPPFPEKVLHAEAVPAFSAAGGRCTQTIGPMATPEAARAVQERLTAAARSELRPRIEAIGLCRHGAVIGTCVFVAIAC